MRKLVPVLAALFLGPALALAAGGNNMPASPPKPSETTRKCKGAKVWDKTRKKCVKPQKSSLNEDELYQAVRELAYAGRYADAQAVLEAMPDQNDDRVLTYWGFTWRKMGRGELARAYYVKAITRNPDNLLARSYMGQGMVEDGDIAAAWDQLREIRMRGGAGTWPEVSLRDAILSGRTYSF